jgi:hypothetical protein
LIIEKKGIGNGTLRNQKKERSEACSSFLFMQTLLLPQTFLKNSSSASYGGQRRDWSIAIYFQVPTMSSIPNQASFFSSFFMFLSLVLF